MEIIKMKKKTGKLKLKNHKNKMKTEKKKMAKQKPLLKKRKKAPSLKKTFSLNPSTEKKLSGHPLFVF
jgi:hypothetical protein